MDRITSKFLAKLDEDKDGMVQWCMNMGLISRQYECPMCGSHMKLVKLVKGSDGKQWRCKNNGHDVKRSIRKGSWFGRSKLSFYEILMLTYYWCGKVSGQFVESDLGISHTTIADWKNFCREVCAEIVIETSEMLGGDNVIVEIDESKFGKWKYHRGRYVDGRWVFGGVERGTNKCFMVVVPNRSADVLLDIIRRYIRPGTIIISDCWRAYNTLQHEGFQHLTVNHSYNFKDPVTGAHTNSIEGTWSAIKRQLSSNTNTDLLESSLFEYMWRRRHTDSNNVYNVFLEAVATLYTPQTRD